MPQQLFGKGQQLGIPKWAISSPRFKTIFGRIWKEQPQGCNGNCFTQRNADTFFPQKLLWPLCFVNSAHRLVWPLYSNICTVISSINIFLTGKCIRSKVTLCNATNSQHHLKIQQFSTHFFTCKAVTICADEDSLPTLNFTSLVEEILLTKFYASFQDITVFQYHLSVQAWEMPFKFIEPWGKMDPIFSLILPRWGRHKSCV